MCLWTEGTVNSFCSPYNLWLPPPPVSSISCCQMDLLTWYHFSTLKPSIIPTVPKITFHILTHVKGSLHCNPSPLFSLISISLGDPPTPAQLVCAKNPSFFSFSDAKLFGTCWPYPSNHYQVHLAYQGILITCSFFLYFARIPSP